MLSHILLATDVSPASDEMLGCVQALRHVGTRQVTLAHVLDVRNVGGLYDQLRALLLPKLESQQRTLKAAGFEVGIEIPWGTPHVEINRLARERSCSRIVVASHGDPKQTKILIVALPETTPVLEAAALQEDLRRAQIEPWAWVVNASLAAAAPSDPLLVARARSELTQIHAVRQELTERVALVPWMGNEPVGPVRLRELTQPRAAACSNA